MAVKFSWKQKQKLPGVYTRLETRLACYRAGVVIEEGFLLPLLDHLSLIPHMTKQGKTAGTRRRRFAKKLNGLFTCLIQNRKGMTALVGYS